MNFKTIDAIVNNEIKENKWTYTLSLLCICVGIVVGIYSVKYMDSILKQQLFQYISSFTASKNPVIGKDIFVEALKNNLPLILAVWFLGLTIIGVPFILIIQIIKGFTLGFTFSFFINTFGGKGIVFSLLGVLPQNIIYLALLTYTSVIAMKFSISLLREKSSWRNNVIKKISRYTTTLIFIFLGIIVGTLIEMLLSLLLFNIINF